MKRLLFALVSLWAAILADAQTVGQIKLSQLTATSPFPAYTDTAIVPTGSFQLWAFTAGEAPVPVNIGANLIVTGTGPYTLAAGSSIGTTANWGLITGTLSTQTDLATALAGKVATSQTVNGVALSGNITVPAAAGTLTGSTLASNVTASSLTSVGTLTNLTVTNPIAGSVTGSSGSTTGNAATATKLANARTINGTAFDGTANITVTAVAAAGTLTGTSLASNVVSSSLTSAAGGSFGTNAFNSTAFLSANQTITLSGDVSGSGATSIASTVTGLNGTNLAGLATGLLKNTTSTGVPSIAVAGTDYSTPAATETLTNKTISGSSNTLSAIPNSSLTYSAITIAGSSTSLGGSITLNAILNSAGSVAQGDILYYNGTNWVFLTPGTSGYVLTTYGASANPAWAAASGGGTVTITGTPTANYLTTWASSTSIQASQYLPAANEPAHTGDVTNSAGSLTLTASKVNGVSYGTSPATNTVPVVTGTNAVTYEAVPNAALANSAITIAGTSTSLGGSITASAILSSLGSPAQGTVIYYNGSTWTYLPAGTSGQYLETLGSSSNPQWNTPSGSGSGNVSNSGSITSGYLAVWNSTTTIVADQYLPAGNEPAHTGDMTNSAGSLTTVVGHVNGVTYGASPSTNTVPVVTGANTVTYEAVPNAALANSAITIAGASTSLGGSITATTILSSLGSAAQGDVIYYNGTSWVFLAPGTSGQYLETLGAAANPQWNTVSASAGGSNTQVQFNNSGSLSGSSNFIWNGTDVAISTTGLGLLITNTNTTNQQVLEALCSNSGGSAQIVSQNDTANQLIMACYGSTAGIGLANNSAIDSTKALALISDSASASGGTDTIQFRIGGYNAANEVSRFCPHGILLLTTTDNSNGVIQIAANTTSTTGIAFGNDATQTNLYRSTTSTLKTDAAFISGGLHTANGGITIASGQTLQIGNAYVGGTYTTGTGSVDIKDSSGTTYHVIVHN